MELEDDLGGETPQPDVTETTSTEETETAVSAAEGADAVEDELDLSSEEEGEPSDESSPAQARSTRLQKLIDEKYSGDEDSFVDGLYEQWNSSSKMNKELKALRETVAQLIESRETAVDHPDIQELNQQLSDLEADRKGNTAKRTSILTRLDDVRAKINRSLGKLESADEFQKVSIESRIEALKEREETLVENWEGLDKDDKRIDVQSRYLKRNLKHITDNLQAQALQQRNQKAQEAQGRQEILKDFFSSVKEAADKYKVPKENVKHMANVVRAEIALYLSGLAEKDPDGPGIDIEEAVNARVAAYAKNMRKAGGAAPKAPNGGGAGSKVPSGSPTPARPNRVSTTPKNATEARALISSILDGKSFVK